MVGMVKKIYLARPRGFCAGVVMAIQAVEDAADEMKRAGEGELVVYHSIVHNDTVVRRLERERGIHFVEDLSEVDSLTRKVEAGGGRLSETVVFSAHGISPEVRGDADARRMTTLDATCPLVTKVHSEAKKYAALGYHILLIGDSTRHQEVIGTVGEAPDQTTVVSVIGNRKEDADLAEPETVQVPDPDKVVVLTQTTLSVDLTMQTVEILKKRYPNLLVPRDDLCYATKNRQDAVRKIGNDVDLFLVVTSSYSSNGMRLLELADEVTGNAKRIDRLEDIQEEWLEGIDAVGITSAASTPDDLVQDLVGWFRARNPDVEVLEEGEWEDITFRKPELVPPQPTLSQE
jgi:4-hydroxy-3-methylbut-2-enyl diphosphate reductase